MSHVGCYTVFSAPNKARNILGGVVVLDSAKDLEIQGNVFTECTYEEALALLTDAEDETPKPKTVADQDEAVATSSSADVSKTKSDETFPP